MKPTTYFLALGLATTGLAAPAPETLVAREDSNVLICKEVNCLGNDQVNIGVTINQCRNVPTAPTNYTRQISAIAPNGILRCFLYDGPDCTGAQAPVAVDSRVNDLSQAPYFFNDRTWSLNCTRK